MLWVTGEKDQVIVGDRVRDYLKNLTGLVNHEIPNGSHTPFYEQEHEVLPWLSNSSRISSEIKENFIVPLVHSRKPPVIVTESLTPIYTQNKVQHLDYSPSSHIFLDKAI